MSGLLTAEVLLHQLIHQTSEYSRIRIEDNESTDYYCCTFLLSNSSTPVQSLAQVLSSRYSMSPGEKQLSWVVLIIGTLLWPIVLPNAYLALLEKN
jgi:hypothetical protein